MRKESVWKARQLHIFTEGAVEMKEWRTEERLEGCGLANRLFFEVPETGKLKSLQKNVSRKKVLWFRRLLREHRAGDVMVVVLNDFINCVYHNCTTQQKVTFDLLPWTAVTTIEMANSPWWTILGTKLGYHECLSLILHVNLTRYEKVLFC